MLTRAQLDKLNSLRLCDLWTEADGLRYRDLWDGVYIIAEYRKDGGMQLKALIFPYWNLTKPFSPCGLSACKDFVRRLA